MTLGISTLTPEGIVLAADSRQSYFNQNRIGRIGSDSASKIFKLSERSGLIVAGSAFLFEKNEEKNISYFIDNFIKSTKNIDKLSIGDISSGLQKFFKKSHKESIDNLQNRVVADLTEEGCKIDTTKIEEEHILFTYKDIDNKEEELAIPIPQLEFIIAGYDDANINKIYRAFIPGGVYPEGNSNDNTNSYGSTWIGQTDVISRIVLGVDERIGNLRIMSKLTKTQMDQFIEQAAGLEYDIQWGTMTLQDGIDFSTLAIETTAAIQRFSDGILMGQGDMPGVGGPIDVAIIHPEKGFVWVAKKKLKFGDNEVDLEEVKQPT